MNFSLRSSSLFSIEVNYVSGSGSCTSGVGEEVIIRLGAWIVDSSINESIVIGTSSLIIDIY
jgi:hypothetical protein